MSQTPFRTGLAGDGARLLATASDRDGGFGIADRRIAQIQPHAEIEACFRRQRHHRIGDRFRCILFDPSAAGVAVSGSHPGIEKAQVIINLCDGANRRARVSGVVFLANRQGGAYPHECHRHPACLSGPGTAWHKQRGRLRTAFVPRRREYQKQDCSCRFPILR